MNSASGILRYLASCYQENGSRSGITSLESSRVRASLILEGEDVIVSDAILDGQHFVPGKKAAALATQALLYEKDRDLFYGAIFLIGKLEGEEERRKPAFAPLILYPVSVEQVMEETGAEFAIDTSRRILNYAVLESLGDKEFLAVAENAVDASSHTEACVSELRRVLEEQLPDLDPEPCVYHPKFIKKTELRDILTQSKEGEGGLFLASGAALFLADKSTEMRGVLNNLEEMASRTDLRSAPVAALLGLSGKKTRPTTWARRQGRIPAVLSEAQQRVVHSSHQHPVTLAVGPPGTGKSFTIAALAIEAMSRGESVLVVSKMDHAVDVVADKVEQSLDLTGVCVRAGRRNYLKELKSFLEDLLSGLFTQADSEVSSREVNQRDKELRQLSKQIERTEYALEKRCRREEAWGELLADPDPGIFRRWRQGRIRKHALQDITAADLAGKVTERITRRTQLTIDYLQMVRRYFLNKSLQNNRATFQAFSKGIRARTSYKKEEYFARVDWTGLLQALPVWLVNLSDLHRVIPMETELFDLVIIDEASQCDIASALPALERAKRAVITGDPKQLRHISFLPDVRQRELAALNGMSEDAAEQFDFRRVSLVDLASDAIQEQERIIFLNEHFRSRPEIIGFSNREFYANQLAIMTGHREIDRHGGPALTLHSVAGTRDESGVNEAEIDAIFAQLVSLTESGKALTAGVLCPFRAQVEAIQKRIEKSSLALTLLQRNQLLVGTSYSFQGEERDIMFLSFALDDQSPSASFRFLEKEDVFNVAITRARLENRVFVSFDGKEKGGGLVGRYLNYIEASDSGSGGQSNRVESVTEPCLLELKSALEKSGIEVAVDFSIGGYQVDLLCSRGDRSLGIDVIGFPGPQGEAMSLERHLALGRAGIQLMPISLLEWQVKREEMLKQVARWLGESSEASK